MPTPHPLNPHVAADAVLATERLRALSLLQAGTLAEMTICLVSERLKFLCEDIQAYDIGRLRAGMRGRVAAGKDPLEALPAAASTGHLDFPHASFGAARADAKLRQACKAVIKELDAARAAIPSREEAAELERSVPGPATKALRAPGL